MLFKLIPVFKVAE